MILFNHFIFQLLQQTTQGNILIFNHENADFITDYNHSVHELRCMNIATNRMNADSLMQIPIYQVGSYLRCTLSEFVAKLYHSTFCCLYLYIDSELEQSDRNGIFLCMSRDNSWILSIVIKTADSNKIDNLKSTIYNLAYRANQFVQLHTQWKHKAECLLIFTIGIDCIAPLPNYKETSEIAIQTE